MSAEKAENGVMAGIHHPTPTKSRNEARIASGFVGGRARVGLDLDRIQDLTNLQLLEAGLNLFCVVLLGQPGGHICGFHHVCTPVIWIAVLPPWHSRNHNTGQCVYFQILVCNPFGFECFGCFGQNFLPTLHDHLRQHTTPEAENRGVGSADAGGEA